jgi:hypothetical protein
MPTPKLFTRQYKTKDGKVYIFFRYIDDHNNNFEYQVYELVIAKKAARSLGAPDVNEDSDAELNTRRMCDWVWDHIEPIE